MAEVKICGISDEDILHKAIDAGADYVGFVHFPKSPRHVDGATAKQLIKLTRKRSQATKSVVLLVNPDEALLDTIIADWKPDVLQLHGSETPDTVRGIKQRFQGEVWKALGISNAEDLELVESYTHADRFLFDAKPPKDATRPGGLGEPFDWSILKSTQLNRPWFLAGGLTPDNVSESLHLSGAKALDVSTGVESAPGIKDAAKIKDFLLKAKG